MAYGEDQLAQLWIKAGGPPKAAAMMAKIAKRESGGQAHIDNSRNGPGGGKLNHNGTVDYGLWAINSVHGYDPNKLYNPLYNAKAAVAVYKAQGPKAWSTYNASTDQKYIGAKVQKASAAKAGSYGSGSPVAPATTDPKLQIALGLLGMGGGYGQALAAQHQSQQAKAPATSSYGPAPQQSVQTGRLSGHPLDRPGVHTSKAILSFVGQVAGVYGHPVKLGTGTAHNRLTVNGNVSAHWAGNALDLPSTGKQNLALGRAALIAAGMPAAQARKATGGIYNVGNHQIIFQTNEGGNHFNHVHVGLG